MKEGNQALLAGKYEMLMARLALFAPAMRGFAASGWLGLALNVGKFATLVNPLLGSSTAFVEMQDKTLLHDLREDTERFADEFAWIPALRAKVLYGQNERVVTRGEYHHDPPAESEP